MKITVQDERVFPTTGVVASAGETVEVPHDDDDTQKKSEQPKKGVAKDGDI